jgi:hypothetical protein
VCVSEEKKSKEIGRRRKLVKRNKEKGERKQKKTKEKEVLDFLVSWSTLIENEKQNERKIRDKRKSVCLVIVEKMKKKVVYRKGQRKKKGKKKKGRKRKEKINKEK